MEINTKLYYQSACDLRMPVTPIEYIAGFEIRLAKERYFFRTAKTPFNCSSSSNVAGNKYCANKLLKAAGLPIPNAYTFNKDEFNKALKTPFIDDLKFPLVVKPTTGTVGGTDVLCNITTKDQLKTYMKKCYRKHEFLTIEAFHSNLNAYRVLVFYNKIIGVVQRFPASIVGDGIHSIQEIIALSNLSRKELRKNTSLGPIKVDEEMLIRLNELGVTIDSIPKDKEVLVLCYTCNSTRGGTMESLGKNICKENAALLCRAARTLNLNLVGFDVLCEDILIPIETSRGVIIEANHSPDITIHEHPLAGSKNRVTKRILWHLILKHPISYCLSAYERNLGAIYSKAFLTILTLLGGIACLAKAL